MVHRDGPTPMTSAESSRRTTAARCTGATNTGHCTAPPGAKYTGVLAPGGRFVLNIKDHIRDHARLRVSASPHGTSRHCSTFSSISSAANRSNSQACDTELTANASTTNTSSCSTRQHEHVDAFTLLAEILGWFSGSAPALRKQPGA